MLCQPALWLGVPRRQQERQSPLVLDERLRQPGEGAPPLRPASAGLSHPLLRTILALNHCSDAVPGSSLPLLARLLALALCLAAPAADSAPAAQAAPAHPPPSPIPPHPPAHPPP